MQITPKQALLQKSEPIQMLQKASARAESQAQPQELLGAGEPFQLSYNSQLAEALQSPQASRIRAQLDVPSGTIIDARA